MKTPKYLTLIFSIWTTSVLSQDIQAIRKQILDEGLFLYRLELASWKATDILMQDHSDLLSQINGYLSYPSDSDTRTIFWNGDADIVFSVTFDSTGVEKMRSGERTNATHQENELISLRNGAFEILRRNDDEFFKFYKNTSPNLIPIITQDQKMVIILTGSQENKLLIGNDYKLLFNEKNEMVTKTKLHNSLIAIDQNSDNESNRVGSMHTHIIDDQPYMTSTDICTFMLYMNVFKLKNHVVVSEKGTSIFESDKRNLIIVPQDNSKRR